MALITPFQFNMSISRNVYEGRSEYSFIATAQKIATYSLIPLALIAFFESVVKNMIFFTLANLCIVTINAIYERL